MEDREMRLVKTQPEPEDCRGSTRLRNKWIRSRSLQLGRLPPGLAGYSYHSKAHTQVSLKVQLDSPDSCHAENAKVPSSIFLL
jgi:hypothetical protein